MSGGQLLLQTLADGRPRRRAAPLWP